MNKLLKPRDMKFYSRRSASIYLYSRIFLWSNSWSLSCLVFLKSSIITYFFNLVQVKFQIFDISFLGPMLFKSPTASCLEIKSYNFCWSLASRSIKIKSIGPAFFITNYLILSQRRPFIRSALQIPVSLSRNFDWTAIFKRNQS